jgi:hypothetical protein
VSFSNTQPEGIGHQNTPAFEVTTDVPLTQRQQTDVVGAEYGMLCVNAVDNAISARGIDADRAAAVPSANG